MLQYWVWPVGGGGRGGKGRACVYPTAGKLPGSLLALNLTPKWHGTLPTAQCPQRATPQLTLVLLADAEVLPHEVGAAQGAGVEGRHGGLGEGEEGLAVQRPRQRRPALRGVPEEGARLVGHPQDVLLVVFPVLEVHPQLLGVLVGDAAGGEVSIVLPLLQRPLRQQQAVCGAAGAAGVGVSGEEVG